MTTLIKKMSEVIRSVPWREEKWEDEAKDVIAVVLNHYSNPANITDAMVVAAIAAWSDDYARDAVHDDWKRMIAAAMKAAF